MSINESKVLTMYLLSYLVIYYVTMIQLSLPHLDRLVIVTPGKPIDIQGLKLREARQMSPVLSAGQGVSIRMWWEPRLRCDASTNQRSRLGPRLADSRRRGRRYLLQQGSSRSDAPRVTTAGLGPQGDQMKDGSSFRHGPRAVVVHLRDLGWCWRPGG